MSTQDALNKLSTPLRAFILAVAPPPPHDADIARWIDTVAQWGDKPDIQTLDAHLLSRTYLIGNTLTAADVAVYAALHPTLFHAQPATYYKHLAITRYFDHIQMRPPVRAVADSFDPPLPLVQIDVENAPKVVRTLGEVKKKEKAAKPVEGEHPVAKKDKQEKKQEPREKDRKEAAVADAGLGVNAKKGSGRAPAAPANEPTIPIPSMIDLRVGHIVDVKKHPDADGLYVEQIDIGETTGPRTVVSGLVNYIPIEQMHDKRLVVVCNLKPANMRGVKSHAMVLCATSKEGKEGGIEIIDPPPDAKPGDRVYFEGSFENDTPLEQLNPKKKIFETIQPGFVTLETREAAWVDPVSGSVHRIRTATGVCTAPTFVGASLS